MTLLSIQINHHAGTSKHNNYKRHDKLGYSSICNVGSKLGSDDEDDDVDDDVDDDGCQRRKSTSYRYIYRGDIVNLTYSITIRYILTSSACVVCNPHRPSDDLVQPCP